MNDVDLAGLERSSAVREIQIPDAHEALVEAEASDLVSVTIDVRLPLAKRRGVVMTDPLHVDHLHLSGRLRRSRDGGDGWQATTREDERFDEVPVPLRSLIAAVGDDDRLERNPPAGANSIRERGEELVMVLPVDGLDHLDGHDLVKGALKVAVVAALHVDPVAQAQL